MIGQIIYGILSANTNLTNLVDKKIYAASAAEGKTLPYITYQQVSKTPNKTKDRVIDKQSARVQIDVFAKTYDEATNIADKVSDALSYYSGTVNTYNVEIIVFEDENDLTPDMAADIFRKEQDYIIKIQL